jgi:hypothetical protein
MMHVLKGAGKSEDLPLSTFVVFVLKGKDAQ